MHHILWRRQNIKTFETNSERNFSNSIFFNFLDFKLENIEFCPWHFVVAAKHWNIWETNLLRVRTNRPNLTSTMPGHVAAKICKRSIWEKYSTRQGFYKLIHGQKCKCLKLTFLVQVWTLRPIWLQECQDILETKFFKKRKRMSI